MIYEKTYENNHYIHKYYSTIPCAINLNTFEINNAGYIIDWELMLNNELFIGENIEELINKLLEIKNKYNLQKRSDYNKDALIIYTNNLEKIYGFLLNYDDNIYIFGKYYLVFKDIFEFRNINLFFDDNLLTINNIYTHAEQLINELFIPNCYCYLTPTQSVTKKIKKHCNDNIAKDIYPNTYELYLKLYKSYFGGLCICNYPGLIIEDYQTVEYDRTSAYIYDLLIEKHASEPLKAINSEWYAYYIEHEDDYLSLGKYEITFLKLNKGSDLFKDVYGKKLKINRINEKITLYLTNTDFKVLENLSLIQTINCVELYVSKKDYLPQYLREIIEEEYIKKINSNSKIQKKKVNAIYGACVKKMVKYNEERKKPSLTPQWGILTASYARYNLLITAQNLKCWLYSDTDSIYCEYCEENIQKIEEINTKIDNNIRKYCNKFNSNYELLQDLGKFKTKKIMNKFKANSKKQYMYTTIDGKFEFKGSGINVNNDESAYYGNIHTGYKVIGHINKEITEIEINGKKYISNGSYYTTKIGNDDINGQAEMWLNYKISERRK